MNLSVFVLLISGSIGLLAATIDFLHRGSLTVAAFLFIIIAIFCYIILMTLFERFIYKRIRNVYKLIRNLKMDKGLKDALGEKITNDPIGDAEREVKDWAKQRVSEIDKLREQAKFRKEFLSNISHEFKTPLFTTQGYIETLQDGLMEDNPEIAKSFLEKAMRNLDRLSYLIQDLDEISKLETGIISLTLEQFDVVALIQECMEDLEENAKQNDIRLAYRGKINQVIVKADRKRIQQVLINLLDNSIKYGKRGGTTSVSIFSLFDQILIEVTDNGMGIDEKNLPRVFERFYRTDKSRSREIGGSGLGLAIVKHIIEAHAQSVNVRSTEGLGTTFGFTLERLKHS